MDTIKLSIVTPNGEIFSSDVDTVTLPGKEGEFGVLAGHASLVSPLNVGVIEIEQNGKKEAVAINWGYATVNESEVNVLVDGAVAITDGGDISANIEAARELVNSVQDASGSMAIVESRINSYA
jgi:F-type H+-transporting ATPase subunit epsilon